MSRSAAPLPDAPRETEAAAPVANRPSRLWPLDALRGVAVLLVLGRHILTVPPSLPAPMRAVLVPWNRFGWIGVDLFFVLSGFLVSGLLFHEHRRYGTIRPLWFLGRRGFKIYPAFYAMLAVSWIWFGASAPPGLFVHEALFVQNYFAPLWNHTWSLAVEEHFYLGLTAVLWLLSRSRSADPFRRLPWMAAVIMALVLALRGLAFAFEPKGHLLYATHHRVDALLFGTVLAHGWFFHRAALESWTRRHVAGLTLLSLLLLVPCLVLPLRDSAVVNTVGLTANYLGFGGLVLAAVAGFRPSPWQTRLFRPLAAVGVHSYSIYLWHMAAYMQITQYLVPRLGAAAAIAGYFVGAIAFGWLMARLVEQPFLWIRDRVLPSRTA